MGITTGLGSDLDSSTGIGGTGGEVIDRLKVCPPFRLVSWSARGLGGTGTKGSGVGICTSQ